jgi:hypothetical protein
MRKSAAISGMALLALALATLFEARKLPFGGLSSPQAGFFPLILAILLAVFSLPVLSQAVKDDNANRFVERARNLRGIGLALAALLAFALLFERLGYMVSSFLFIAFLLRAVERQKWWLVVAVAFSTSLVSYLIFGWLLGMSLPAGILGI